MDDLALSISGGSLELNGFAIWDPKTPERHIFKAQSMRFELSVGDALRGRVNAEEAVLRGVDLQIDGRADGSTSLDALTPFKGTAGGGGSGGAGGLLDWAKGKALDATDADWAELIERLRPYLEERRAGGAKPTEEFPPPGPDGAGWNIPFSTPRWIVQRAALEECRLLYTRAATSGSKAKRTEVTGVSGEIRDWSSDRDLHPKPITFTLSGRLAATDVALEGEMAQPAKGGGLTLKLPNAKDALQKRLGGLFGGK